MCGLDASTSASVSLGKKIQSHLTYRPAAYKQRRNIPVAPLICNIMLVRVTDEWLDDDVVVFILIFIKISFFSLAPFKYAFHVFVVLCARDKTLVNLLPLVEFVVIWINEMRHVLCLFERWKLRRTANYFKKNYYPHHRRFHCANFSPLSLCIVIWNTEAADLLYSKGYSLSFTSSII